MSKPQEHTPIIQTLDLTEKEKTFVQALTQNGGNISQAGKIAGVSLATSSRWFKKPHIQEALAIAATSQYTKTESWERHKQQIVLPELFDKIQKHIPKAFDELINLSLHSKSEKVKLDAIKEIIRISGVLETTVVTGSESSETTISKGLSPEQADNVRRQIFGLTGYESAVDVEVEES